MKRNLAIVTGGYSGEKVISLKSANFVKDHVDEELYQARIVYIDMEKWVVMEGEQEIAMNRHDFSYIKDDQAIRFDLVYLILHGDPGENGKLQAYFDLLGIPYTSCNAVSSALTFNKFFTNKTVSAMGVNVAPSYHLYEDEQYSVEQIIERTSLPCFVKPNAGGSSIGMSRVENAEELVPAIERAFKEDNEVLIEQFVKGRELTCAVIQSEGELYVLPICEVVSKKSFFDYEAKYDPSLADEIIPAPIEADLEVFIKSQSVFLYKQLNCKGIVRIDYIWDGEELYFLEVNSIPGLSGESIVPKMARVFGWSSEELIRRVLNEAR